MIASTKCFVSTRGAQPVRSSRATMPVSCELAVGTKVRVTAPVKIFHVGKFKAGLELKGMEGTVVGDARQHKGGLELSATLPWKVQFEAKDGDGKAVKVIAHLVSCGSCALDMYTVAPSTPAHHALPDALQEDEEVEAV